MVQVNRVGLKWNGTYQRLAYDNDDVNLLIDSIETIKEHTVTSTGESKEICLEARSEKIKHMLLPRHQNKG
jgi:hypothetical protein